MKIGVFDSGVGGMTVLSEIRKSFPDVDYIYLGDTANVPYGTKSSTQVRKLSVECAKTLRDKGISKLVVACNTASSWALEDIREVCGAGIQVLGVVEPGVSVALQALKATRKNAPVLVLATRATVKSGVYSRLLKKETSLVLEQACPLLVPMIEEGLTDHPILQGMLEHYVGSYRQEYEPGVALLGCTHYPWIQRAVEKVLPGWSVVNSASAVVKALESDFLKANQAGSGQVEWLFTDPEAIPHFVLPLS